MDMLILGGTSWLGGEVARDAVERGHQVTCLARGDAGAPPAGVRFTRADRWDATAYDEVAGTWDAVLDLTWQPALAHGALKTLAHLAGHWLYVSSVSVYADPGGASEPADESGRLREPWEGQGPADPERYGEAKVACEAACAAALREDRLTVVRPGLLSGYGDRSDRLGYWVARAAQATGERRDVLVPDMPQRLVQVVDVEDLACWLLDLVERELGGRYDAVGDPVPYADLLEACAACAGTDPCWRPAPEEWLAQQGVGQWMGPESLPLWIADPAWERFMARPNARARAAGLRLRPLHETLAATLRWERELGLDRERSAGLSQGRESALLTLLAKDGDGGNPPPVG